ncbi:MAG: nucleotidyl transferase AbiEii/AbiGii toxin family protein [Candidatus Cloacimonetes bacterium]|nr:nucleotidyl transferase AbiEii/AbiGii toxin family protein [Candidatus Cloacimonadota bacterium]
MFKHDNTFLSQQAKDLGFIRDTYEKVVRLTDVLEFLNNNPLLKKSLALKGGTAINFTIFDLPRLSVDIDLDYLISNSREEMLEQRQMINVAIDRFMVSQGYQKNSRSKNPHSLDSWIYDYTGVSGNKDNIKIEINYSLRAHIFHPEERLIIPENIGSKEKIKILNPLEIYGSKINALLSRAAARDLYDTKNMISHCLFNPVEEELLRKCVVFYMAISSQRINKKFSVEAIHSINQRKIKTELYPVIKNSDKFNLLTTKEMVVEYILNLMELSKDENKFLDQFEHGNYVPELLFEDEKIIDRIKGHPMALWKTKSY